MAVHTSSVPTEEIILFSRNKEIMFPLITLEAIYPLSLSEPYDYHSCFTLIEEGVKKRYPFACLDDWARPGSTDCDVDHVFQICLSEGMLIRDINLAVREFRDAVFKNSKLPNLIHERTPNAQEILNAGSIVSKHGKFPLVVSLGPSVKTNNGNRILAFQMEGKSSPQDWRFLISHEERKRMKLPKKSRVLFFFKIQ